MTACRICRPYVFASPTSEEGPPYLTHAYNARWGYLADETGLYYCQNRYYDPVTGRFLTRDPIGYDGGANLYGYCGGNPVLSADPSGLLTWQSLIEFGFGCSEGGRWAYDPIGNACESGLNTAKFEIYALGHPSEAWHQFLDSWNFWDAPDARTAGRRLGPWVQLLGCVAGGIAAKIGPLSTSEAPVESLPAEASVQGTAVESLPKALPTEGVYKFSDGLNPGKSYIGQSGNIPRRLGYWKRTGRLREGDVVETMEVLGGKFARELAEQEWIKRSGGIKGGSLSNERNPIGPRRRGP